MSLKRIIPVFLLLTLAISLMACQSQPAEESVDSQAEVEQGAVEATGDELVGQEAAPAKADEATARKNAGSNQGETPEFIPPEPVILSTEPEAVAFAMGDPDAPVQIVEFTDFQCPFCQRHALETMPALVENLVESGRVFYAIKDLPLDAIHPEARPASIAARCAGQQDAYLPMHDAIFAAQADWRGAGDQAEAVFSDLAAGLDLDVDSFSSCVADGRQAENVQANVDEALALGVNSTPFFFIDGYGMPGAQPFEMFEMAVGLAEKDLLDDLIEAQARQAYEAMLAQQAALAEQAPAPAAVPVEVTLNGANAIGDPNAPVTIIEYTDYQCPFCARHALNTFSQISETMVGSGQVRYVFKDMPLASIHPQATLAAEAARCAGAQDQQAYVAMHDTLFQQQKAWSGQTNAADLFTSYAADLGLDGETFATCLENHDFEAAVQADIEEARQLGFRGTPAFLINGQPLYGAQPYEVFEQAIESSGAEAAVQTATN